MIYTNRYEVKLYLQSYKHAKKEVDRLNSSLRELDADMCSLKATDYSKERVNGNTPQCILDAIIDEKDKTIKLLEEKTKYKHSLKMEIIEFINQLDNNYLDCDVLIDRYINLLSIRDIGRKYTYSEEVVYNKMSLACKKLAILSNKKYLK